jgi:hypothetical protein
MTVFYCNICEREFVHEAALQMHVQKSKVHKKEARRLEKSTAPTEVETTPQLVSNTVLPSTSLCGQQPPTENTALISSGVQYQPQNGNVAAVYVSTLLQQFQMKATGNSSLSVAQNTSNGDWGSFQHGRNQWSLIPIPQQSSVFEALFGHCHSFEDLQRNRYRLRPYNSDDMAGIRRCRNCGSKFQTSSCSGSGLIGEDLQKNAQKGAQSRCYFHSGKRQTMVMFWFTM